MRKVNCSWKHVIISFLMYIYSLGTDLWIAAHIFESNRCHANCLFPRLEKQTSQSELQPQLRGVMSSFCNKARKKHYKGYCKSSYRNDNYLTNIRLLLLETVSLMTEIELDQADTVTILIGILQFTLSSIMLDLWLIFYGLLFKEQERKEGHFITL